QLPIAGRVARVTIEGECVVGDVPTTRAGLEPAVRSPEQELDQQGREIQALRESLAARQQASLAERARLEREIGRRDRQSERRERELEQRDGAGREARGARDSAEAELAAAFSSLSFRLTAPLRAGARQARRTWRQGRAFADGALRGADSGDPWSRPHAAH